MADDCYLVNMFGKVATEETQVSQDQLLRELVIQLRILNIHMQKLSDEKVLREDVKEIEL